MEQQQDINTKKNLAEAPLTDEEMATHRRVYEMSLALGEESPEAAMTRGTMAVIGLRLFGNKEGIHSQLKEGWKHIFEETLRVKAAKEAQSLICPPDPNPEGSIIIPGRAGLVER